MFTLGCLLGNEQLRGRQSAVISSQLLLFEANLKSIYKTETGF